VTGATLSHRYTSEGDQIHCVVTVSDATASAEVTTEDVLVQGYPPLDAELSVHLIPEEPTTTNDLECVTDVTSEIEELLVSFRWFRDGVEITEGLEVEQEYFSVTAPTLSRHFTSRGQTFYCNVRVTDGTGIAEAESNSVIIQNTPPTAPIVRILPENPTPIDGLAIYIDQDSVDADDDDFFYVIEWYESLDGENWTLRPLISGRRTFPYLQGQPQISNLYTQMAEFWRVDVTPIEAWTLPQKGAVSSGPTGTKMVYILPDLGGDHFVNGSDLVTLISNWNKTKGELPEGVKPLFFEGNDPDSAKVGVQDLIKLGTKGWYRGN
jgi:hypothetical protein